jgi:tetratricopeptide (TPR) repeat protein
MGGLAVTQMYRIDGQRKTAKERERDAIALASQGQWEEAVVANRDVVAVQPNDVEAMNRLGKALSELGQYGGARDVYRKALALVPGNTIARRNLARIEGLKDTPRPPKVAAGLASRLFLEESGKTARTELAQLASSDILNKLVPGEPVELAQEGKSLVVRLPGGVRVGRVGGKIAARLMRLMRGGNRYAAAIASTDGHRVSIMVREEYKHPSLAAIVSFPSSAEGKEPYMDDLEGVVEAPSDEQDGAELAEETENQAKVGEEEEEEPGKPPRAARSRRAIEAEDEDDEEEE